MPPLGDNEPIRTSQGAETRRGYVNLGYKNCIDCIEGVFLVIRCVWWGCRRFCFVGWFFICSLLSVKQTVKIFKRVSVFLTQGLTSASREKLKATSKSSKRGPAAAARDPGWGHRAGEAGRG